MASIAILAQVIPIQPMLARLVIWLGIWVGGTVLLFGVYLLWFVLVDFVQWCLALRRCRVVRSDRPQMAIEDEGFIAPTHVLPFDRKRVDPIEDRWQRLQLDGLAMSPYDLDGRRN